MLLFLVLFILSLLTKCHQCAFEGLTTPPHHKDIPQNVMIGVVNRLGLKVLEVHSRYNEDNIAISPYGILMVLIAIQEGVKGFAADEIYYAADIPPNPALVRIGLRDIHRHLKSYFIPKEGFLAGLILNHGNITLRNSYKEILEFYGLDIEAFNKDLYNNFNKTEGNNSVVLNENGNDSATSTPSGTSTTEPTVGTTLGTTIHDTSTDAVTDVTTELPTSNQDVPNVSTTSTPLTEGSTETVKVTTLAMETTSPGLTTPEQAETTKAEESTTPKGIQEDGTAEVTTLQDKVSSESPTSEATTIIIDVSSTETTLTESETTTTEMEITTNLGSNSEPESESNTEKITSSSESETTTEISLDETTASNASETTTETSLDETTASSASETTTETSLDETTASSATETTTEGNVEETTTTEEAETTTILSSETTTALNEDKPAEVKNRRKRSIEDYIIAKYYDSLSEIHYQPPSNIPGFSYLTPPPPFSSSSQINPLMGTKIEGTRQVTNNKDQLVNTDFMRYDTVLPYFYSSTLSAKILKLPLDNENYYLLLALPNTDEIYQLTNNLMEYDSLRNLVNNLRDTRVQAFIPTFSLKGIVVLTQTLKKMGIRGVFDPFNNADFSGMTLEPNVYITNIEQAISVNIKHFINEKDLKNEENKGRNQQYDRVEFVADHPFLYFVMDSQLDVCLMAGRIVNPISSRIS